MDYIFFEVERKETPLRRQIEYGIQSLNVTE